MSIQYTTQTCLLAYLWKILSHCRETTPFIWSAVTLNLITFTVGSRTNSHPLLIIFFNIPDYIFFMKEGTLSKQIRTERSNPSLCPWSVCLWMLYMYICMHINTHIMHIFSWLVSLQNTLPSKAIQYSLHEKSCMIFIFTSCRSCTNKLYLFELWLVF